MKLSLSTFHALALLCISHTVRAQTHVASDGDGLYGRWDTDSTASLAVGGTYLPAPAPTELAIDARLRIIDTLGLYVRPSFQLAAQRGGLALGLDIRPLFLWRFTRNRYLGIEWLDRVIDSLGVDLGVVTSDLVVPKPAFDVMVGADLPLYPMSLIYLRIAAGARVGEEVIFQATAQLGFRFGVRLGLWPNPR